MTNGDKIRSMTDEELVAFFLLKIGGDEVCPVDNFPQDCCKFIPCCECWKRWLKQEAENDD